MKKFLLSFLPMLMLCLTALAGEPTIKVTFPMEEQGSVGSYSTSWTGKLGDQTWTFANFNNNANKWQLIKCGWKTAAIASTITTPVIEEAITDLVITFDQASGVNSAKVEVKNGEEVVETVDFTPAAGEVDIKLTGTAGASYVVTIDNAKTSSNGTTVISQIALYEAGKFAPAEPIANTAETAYTVVKARELIDAGESLTDQVYVKGIIAKIDQYYAQGKQIVYWISDDGTMENALECFDGFGLDKAEFESENDIEVGAAVIVTGQLNLYNGIYQLNKGNYMVSYTPAPILKDNTEYFFQNVEVGGFLAGGNDWGTHASCMNKPQNFTALLQEDGTYKLDSHQFNGADAHFVNTGYLDNAGTTWTVKKVEGGIMLKSADGLYITAGTLNGTLSFVAEPTEKSVWVAYTIADVKARMAGAAVNSPVDVTELILNPTIKRNANTSWYPTWTITNYAGDGNAANFGQGQNGNVANCAESWKSNNGFKITQTIADLKAGVYRLDAQGFTNLYDPDNQPSMMTLSLNDETAVAPARNGSFASMPEAYTSMLNGEQTIEPLFVSIEEGASLTITFQNENTNSWNIMGELKLSYYGECSIEDAKNYDPNDRTDLIENADLSDASAGWTLGNTKGIADNMIKVSNGVEGDIMTQTIHLTPGQYKLIANAVYRFGGNEQEEYDAIQAGTDTKLTTLFATTSTATYDAPIMNRWDGATDESITTESCSTVAGKQVPNSSNAVNAYMKAGQYANELIFNVQEECDVVIGIKKTTNGNDYLNIGTWALKLVSETPDLDPTIVPGQDITKKIVNPGFETGNNTGWSFEGTSGNRQYYAKAAEAWNNNAYVCQQTITDLPNGKYKVTAQVDNGMENNNVFLFANDATVAGVYRAISSYDACSNDLAADRTLCRVELEALVTNGTITIGVKDVSNGNGWVIFDDFTLQYIGEYSVEDLKAGYMAAVEAANTAAEAEKMNAEAASALQNAITTYGALTEEAAAEDYLAATKALNEAAAAATTSAEHYAAVKAALEAQKALINGTNVYDETGMAAYVATYEELAAKYEAGTLTNEDGAVNPAQPTGWHASTAYNFLLTPWTIAGEAANNFDKDLYINTWSNEAQGKENGSEMYVPFFEYWTGDDSSLAANTLATTITGLEPGKNYEVSVLVRVRMKNGVTEGANGITLTAGEGEPVDVCAGEPCDDGAQFVAATFTAAGLADAEGNLVVSFTIAEENNISWLSYKNVKYVEGAPVYTYALGAPSIEVERTTSADTKATIAFAEASTDNAEATLGLNPATSEYKATIVDAEGNEVVATSAIAFEEGKLIITFTTAEEKNLVENATYSVVLPAGTFGWIVDGALVAADEDIKVEFTAPADPETAIAGIAAQQAKDGKYVRNNKVIIVKAGKQYNAAGARMK